MLILIEWIKMADDKLNSSLKQLLSYVKSCPILVKPKSSGLKNYLIKKLEDLGGAIEGSYFGNNLMGQIPLKSLKELAKDDAIEKIKFRGNNELVKQSPVLDNNLIELLQRLLIFLICFLHVARALIHPLGCSSRLKTRIPLLRCFDLLI